LQSILLNKPQSEVPSYTTCMHAAFQERLYYEGMDLYVSLIANLSLHGLPSFKHRTREGDVGRTVNKNDAGYLDYREFTEYLGVFATCKEFASFEEGLTFLQNSLQAQKPVIAFGSLYYLPYTSSFQSQKYIEERIKYFSAMANHWLLVYGISEDTVHVYDPIPSGFQGELALTDFEGFWKGDKYIPELQGKLQHEELYWSYGYVELEIQEESTAERLQQLSVSALKTIAHEFLASRMIEHEGIETIAFGASALQKLASELEWLEENMQDENWQQLSTCVFDMRSIHLIVRDQLQQMIARFGDTFAEWQQDFLPIAEEWMKIGNSFQLQVMRNRKEVEFLQRLRQRIVEVAARETAFYQKLLTQFPDVPLLCKEEVEAGQPEE
jgi:hypothetical protein